MKIKSLFLSLLCLSVISSSVFAQKKERFGSSTEATSVIKFTPTKIFRGIIELGYEQTIGDRSSLEVNLGPTISNVSPFGNNGHGIFDNQYGLSNSTGSLLGFHSSIGYRFYPVEDKWALNGFYVSPIISFTRYNYNFDDIYSGTLPSQKGYRQETAFGFVFGSQNWLSKFFGIDAYLGAGLKSVNYLSYFTNYDNWTGKSVWVRNAQDRASWFVTAGVKVGIGMKNEK
jgi:hypothetical protein